MKTKYYANQLDKIKIGLTEYSPTIKVFANGNGNDTNHLDLNAESAAAIATWLKNNFSIKLERKVRDKTSLESIFITEAKQGQQMYSKKPGKDIEALSSYYKKDVTTEVCFAICPRTMKSEKVTLITIK